MGKTEKHLKNELHMVQGKLAGAKKTKTMVESLTKKEVSRVKNEIVNGKTVRTTYKVQNYLTKKNVGIVARKTKEILELEEKATLLRIELEQIQKASA